MQARLVPYSEVFISVTLSLDEAAAVMDGLEVIAEHMPDEVRTVTEALRQSLETLLPRAVELQRKKEE